MWKIGVCDADQLLQDSKDIHAGVAMYMQLMFELAIKFGLYSAAE
jgi:hypothetical protein